MKKSLIFFFFLIVPSVLSSQEINNKVNNCNFIIHELDSEKANYPKIEQIDVDENWTANICFGGPNQSTLFITASKSVYTLDMKVKGVR